MPRFPGPFRTITVTTGAPSGNPSDPFSDLAPDEWDVRYRRGATNIVLTASQALPALLWAFDANLQLWTVLERVFQLVSRTITIIDADKIPRAGTGFSSLHVQYPGGVSGDEPIFEARAVRLAPI